MITALLPGGISGQSSRRSRRRRRRCAPNGSAPAGQGRCRPWRFSHPREGRRPRRYEGHRGHEEEQRTKTRQESTEWAPLTRLSLPSPFHKTFIILFVFFVLLSRKSCVFCARKWTKWTKWTKRTRCGFSPKPQASSLKPKAQSLLWLRPWPRCDLCALRIFVAFFSSFSSSDYMP